MFICYVLGGGGRKEREGAELSSIDFVVGGEKKKMGSDAGLKGGKEGGGGHSQVTGAPSLDRPGRRGGEKRGIVGKRTEEEAVFPLLLFAKQEKRAGGSFERGKKKGRGGKALGHDQILCPLLLSRRGGEKKKAEKAGGRLAKGAKKGAVVRSLLHFFASGEKEKEKARQSSLCGGRNEDAVWKAWAAIKEKRPSFSVLSSLLIVKKKKEGNRGVGKSSHFFPLRGGKEEKTQKRERRKEKKKKNSTPVHFFSQEERGKKRRSAKGEKKKRKNRLRSKRLHTLLTKKMR